MVCSNSESDAVSDIPEEQNGQSRRHFLPFDSLHNCSFTLRDSLGLELGETIFHTNNIIPCYF